MPIPGIAGGGRPVDKLRLARLLARVLLEAGGDIDAAFGVVGDSGRGGAPLSRDLRRCSFAARRALAGEISTLPRGSSGSASRSCPSAFSSSSRGGSSNARDDADDCERRTLVEAVVFVDTEDELWEVTCPRARCTEARDVVAKPATEDMETGVDVLGEERSPSSRRLMPCTPSLIPSRGDNGLVTEEVGALVVVRSMPRLTIRSHLRFSWVSSASCMANCERNSRHFDSF